MAGNQLPSYSLVPYSCIYIDAPWRTFFTAMLNCLPDNTNFIKAKQIRLQLCQEIASLFSHPNDAPSLVGLSVRTIFDLFLRVKRFPAKSEIIMSAVNIPGMIDIVRHHGLIPVPWDIDLNTLSPSITGLNQLITERSVAVVVSHLFGKRCTVIDEAVRECKRKGIYFLEDCAELFDAFRYLGHPGSDLVIFSFGVIKHFTAFGGSVCKVRDHDLFKAMEKLYSADPVQSRRVYLKKVCTALVAAVGVNIPLVMSLLAPMFNMIGFDYKGQVVEMLRGFPPGQNLWLRLRQQPSIPLLLTMRERLTKASTQDLRHIKEKGNFVRKLLPYEGVMVPGLLAYDGHDWLFPIIVDRPDVVLKRLNALGVDAVTKATQLTVVNGDPGERSEKATRADYLMNHVIYLPVHKNVPYEFLTKICQAVEIAVRNPENTCTKGLMKKSKL